MRLLSEEPHIWRVVLDPGAASDACLSAHERERASRFHFARDRGRFIASHAALREILASYLDTAPEALEYETNEYGKPRLRGDPHLEFNLAHSNDLALIAVTRGRAIGVDVERLRDDFDRADLAGRYFAPREIERVRAQPERFFEIWTRKEAFIKAIGMGVSFPLQEFDVCEERVRLSSRAPLSHAEWFATSFTPAPGSLAAVVTSSSHITLRHFEYHPET